MQMESQDKGTIKASPRKEEERNAGELKKQAKSTTQEEAIWAPTPRRKSPLRSSCDQKQEWSVPPMLADTCGKISEMHEQIHGVISTLENKIDAVIEKDERNLFLAYRVHLQKINNDLAQCKEQLEGEQLRLQRDATIHSLQESTEHYRLESLRFAKDAAEQKAEVYRLRSSVDSLEHENTFLSKQLQRLRKENKLLLVQLDLQRPQAAPSKEAGSASDAPLPAVPQEDKEEELESQDKSQLKSKLKFKPGYNNTSKHIQTEKPNQKKQGGTTIKDFAYLVRELKIEAVEKDAALDACLKHFETFKSEQDEIIVTLRQQLDHEKKQSYKLRAAQTEAAQSKRELEQLFLECVEEVKKKVIRRRLENARYYRGSEESSWLGPSSSLATDHANVNASLNSNVPELTAIDKAMIMERFFTSNPLLHVLFETVFPTDSKVSGTRLPGLRGPKNRQELRLPGDPRCRGRSNMRLQLDSGQTSPNKTYDFTSPLATHIVKTRGNHTDGPLRGRNVVPRSSVLGQHATESRQFLVKQGKLLVRPRPTQE